MPLCVCKICIEVCRVWHVVKVSLQLPRVRSTPRREHALTGVGYFPFNRSSSSITSQYERAWLSFAYATKRSSTRSGPLTSIDFIGIAARARLIGFDRMGAAGPSPSRATNPNRSPTMAAAWSSAADGSTIVARPRPLTSRVRRGSAASVSGLGGSAYWRFDKSFTSSPNPLRAV